MKILLTKGSDGQHYFAVKDDNHETIAQSEGYSRPEDARRGAENLVESIIHAEDVGIEPE